MATVGSGPPPAFGQVGPKIVVQLPAAARHLATLLAEPVELVVQLGELSVELLAGGLQLASFGAMDGAVLADGIDTAVVHDEHPFEERRSDEDP